MRLSTRHHKPSTGQSAGTENVGYSNAVNALAATWQTIRKQIRQMLIHFDFRQPQRLQLSVPSLVRRRSSGGAIASLIKVCHAALVRTVLGHYDPDLPRS